MNYLLFYEKVSRLIFLMGALSGAATGCIDPSRVSDHALRIDWQFLLD